MGILLYPSEKTYQRRIKPTWCAAVSGLRSSMAGGTMAGLSMAQKPISIFSNKSVNTILYFLSVLQINGDVYNLVLFLGIKQRVSGFNKTQD